MKAGEAATTDAESGTAEAEAKPEDKKPEEIKGPAPPLVIPAPYRARDAQPHLAFLLRYVCEVTPSPAPTPNPLTP